MDSSGNQHDGKIYTAGDMKTVYSFIPLGSKKVYYPGEKVYMPEYEDVGTIYYSTSSGYKRGTERKNCIYGCIKYTGKLYDADGEQVNADSSFYYAGTWRDSLYESGSSLTRASGFKRVIDGETWSYTPIGDSADDLYQYNPEDNEPFTAIGEECTLNLSTINTQYVTVLRQ